jgi:putative transposase
MRAIIKCNYMANSCTNILIHYIFSTKNRKKIITAELEKRLWPYMGGIARENNMKALNVGGIEDHVHLLVTLPPTIPVAKAIQLIKGGASKWVHDTFQNYNNFEWQKGYGAFSVSMSSLEDTISYINAQKQHHKIKTFQEEYIDFLKRYKIKYDERYIWG